MRSVLQRIFRNRSVHFEDDGGEHFRVDVLSGIDVPPGEVQVDGVLRSSDPNLEHEGLTLDEAIRTVSECEAIRRREEEVTIGPDLPAVDEGLPSGGQLPTNQLPYAAAGGGLPAGGAQDLPHQGLSHEHLAGQLAAAYAGSHHHLAPPAEGGLPHDGLPPGLLDQQLTPEERLRRISLLHAAAALSSPPTLPPANGLSVLGDLETELSPDSLRRLELLQMAQSMSAAGGGPSPLQMASGSPGMLWAGIPQHHQHAGLAEPAVPPLPPGGQPPGMPPHPTHPRDSLLGRVGGSSFTPQDARLFSQFMASGSAPTQLSAQLSALTPPGLEDALLRERILAASTAMLGGHHRGHHRGAGRLDHAPGVQPPLPSRLGLDSSGRGQYPPPPVPTITVTRGSGPPLDPDEEAVRLRLLGVGESMPSLRDMHAAIGRGSGVAANAAGDSALDDARRESILTHAAEHDRRRSSAARAGGGYDEEDDAEFRRALEMAAAESALEMRLLGAREADEENLVAMARRASYADEEARRRQHEARFEEELEYARRDSELAEAARVAESRRFERSEEELVSDIMMRTAREEEDARVGEERMLEAALTTSLAEKRGGAAAEEERLLEETIRKSEEEAKSSEVDGKREEEVLEEVIKRSVDDAFPPRSAREEALLDAVLRQSAAEEEETRKRPPVPYSEEEETEIIEDAVRRSREEAEAALRSVDELVEEARKRSAEEYEEERRRREALGLVVGAKDDPIELALRLSIEDARRRAEEDEEEMRLALELSAKEAQGMR